MANRLAHETSPYLLQHAGNPVEWLPWGEEALALARETDRPILLSIGYSACHWCHVMERESFEDPETARLMNRAFVNVKVDREERPDLDSVYMKAVQSMTGQGGWPLTAFLTPEGVPFHGGTYYPPEPRHGMPSFRQVLAAAAQAWEYRRDEALRVGERLRQALERSAGRPHPGSGRFGADDEGLFSHAVSVAGRSFDPVHGGFGGAPKFPQPVFLEFLLRAGSGDGPGASMAVHTLSRMAAGGIRDHCGGGFHRYSVDARWLVPHFEKMLYDNALLARVLVRGSLLGAPGLGKVAQETLDYVLEDLTLPEGVFCSARDADSLPVGGADGGQAGTAAAGRDGTAAASRAVGGGVPEEGAFYLWTPAEVREALGRDAATLFCRAYDVSEPGNFEGRNILHLPHDLDAVARQEGVARDELERVLGEGLAALKARRSERPPPFRDEKVLACWNGFAVRALAEAGPALGRPDYTQAALRAAEFLLDALRPDDRLFRVFCAGRVHVEAFLEDHGALGNAFLSLYEATLDPRWLAEAEWMCDAMVERFWSEGEGLFHDAPEDGEPLVVRPRDILDNATPSGNSLAVELLVRLDAAAGRGERTEKAERVLAREVGAMERYPQAAGRLLTAAFTSSAPRLEVALAGAGRRVDEMLAVAHRHPHPNRTIVGGDPADPAVAALPAMEGRLDRSGRAFVCVGAACQEPADSADALAERLRRTGAVRLMG